MSIFEKWRSWRRGRYTGDNASGATTPQLGPGEAEAPPAAPPPADQSDRAVLDVAQLVARGEEIAATAHALVEYAAAAVAARVTLWAAEDAGGWSLVAWAARDGWRPEEGQAAAPPALLLAKAAGVAEPQALRAGVPARRGVANGWHPAGGELLLHPAAAGGATRGVLAIGIADPATLGEEARADLATIAALAGLLLERHAGSITAGQPAPLIQMLSDRAATEARLTFEVARARRFGQPLTVLLLDIDRFGAYAGAAGPDAAHEMLQRFATLIQGSIREVDICGRNNEDGFIVILPMSGVDDALQVGERIRGALDDAQAAAVDRLTVSGGIVSYPSDGATAEELLAAAERTVAYAKRMGRDQLRIRGLGAVEAGTDIGETGSGGRAVDNEQLDRAFGGLIEALSLAGDRHDHARSGHGRAVGRHARALAESCGLDPDRVRAIELGGILHDVGKIGLPDDILGKQGALTPEELAILRGQPAIGMLIMAQIPSLESVVSFVAHAREHFDGSGYPAGLHGSQIPFGSRIIAIAEDYEAMISDRPYRSALGRGMAIAQLWHEAGKRYDPQLVDTFVRLVTRDEPELTAAWNPELLERMIVAEGAEAAPVPDTTPTIAGSATIGPAADPPALTDASPEAAPPMTAEPAPRAEATNDESPAVLAGGGAPDDTDTALLAVSGRASAPPSVLAKGQAKPRTKPRRSSAKRAAAKSGVERREAGA